MPDDESAQLVGYFIAGIVILAGVIRYAKALFPLFGIATLILLLLGIAGLFFFEDAVPYIGIALLISLFGLVACYGIGYVLGDSQIGQAVTQTAGAITFAQDTLTGAEKNATLTTINALQDVNSELAKSAGNTNPELANQMNNSFEVAKVLVSTS